MIFAALLPLSLALAWVARRFPEVVEAVYARGVYPRLGSLLSRLSGTLPFSVAELLVGAAFVALVAKAIAELRAVRRGKKRLGIAFRDGFVGTMGCAGVLYLSFLLSWGLNYYRLSLAEVRGLDTSEPTVAELIAVCEELVVAANALREEVEEDAHGCMRLPESQTRTLNRAALGYVPLSHLESASQPALGYRYGEPKRPLFSGLLSYVGISGIYFPFTGEAHVNATLPDAILPFTTCHELAHQRGFAREDEANYLAYLGCRLHPDVEFRYSGALVASTHALAALKDPAERERLAARRSAAVRRDLEQYRKWRSRYDSPLDRLSSAVNDAYLRAHGDARGIRSYGRMVDLLIAERRQREGDIPTPPRPPSARGDTPEARVHASRQPEEPSPETRRGLGTTPTESELDPESGTEGDTEAESVDRDRGP